MVTLTASFPPRQLLAQESAYHVLLRRPVAVVWRQKLCVIVCQSDLAEVGQEMYYWRMIAVFVRVTLIVVPLGTMRGAGGPRDGHRSVGGRGVLGREDEEKPLRWENFVRAVFVHLHMNLPRAACCFGYHSVAITLEHSDAVANTKVQTRGPLRCPAEHPESGELLGGPQPFHLKFQSLVVQMAPPLLLTLLLRLPVQQACLALRLIEEP